MVYLTDDEGLTVARTAFCQVELVNASVILRFDPDDRLVGLEILGASRLLPPGVLARAEQDT